MVKFIIRNTQALTTTEYDIEALACSAFSGDSHKNCLIFGGVF